MTHPNDELKACPFCPNGVGIRGSHTVSDGTVLYNVRCRCGAGVNEFLDREEADAAWNTRAKDEANAWRQAIQEHAMATECISWDGKKPWDVINEIILYHVNLAKDDAKGGEAVGFITDETGGPFARFTEAGHRLAPGTPLYTSPRPTADEVRDAKRYRWLRKHRHTQYDGLPIVSFFSQGINYVCWEEYADSVIDAAIAKGGGSA